MGNKLGKRRQVVDEKYTRPQGLYPIKDVDYKKLRKLILETKLAPCYPGADECDSGLLEECPICFLYYPTLNRSRCCSKRICTECFLQLKNPDSIQPTNCPFCKTPNYAVEYQGVKSKEERGLEQIEEQKVIEAKIRMRQQEVQEEEERLHRRQETSYSGIITQTETIDCSTSVVVEGEAVVPSQDSNATPLFRASQNLQQNQYDVFDMDQEEIMVMEAIWLSIQENERARNPPYINTSPEQYSSAPTLQQEGPSSSSSSSPSGGLGSAIAALAERQQVSDGQSRNYSATTSNSLRSGRRTTKKMKRNHRAPKRSSSEFDMQRTNNDNTSSSPWDCFYFYEGSQSQVAEGGTSYGSSNESDNGVELLPLPPPPAQPPLSPESVYISGMSDDASLNGLECDDQQFSYLLPPPPHSYVDDVWSVFAS